MQTARNNTILYLESAVLFLNFTASARGWERNDFQASKVSKIRVTENIFPLGQTTTKR